MNKVQRLASLSLIMVVMLLMITPVHSPAHGAELFLRIGLTKKSFTQASLSAPTVESVIQQYNRCIWDEADAEDVHAVRLSVRIVDSLSWTTPQLRSVIAQVYFTADGRQRTHVFDPDHPSISGHDGNSGWQFREGTLTEQSWHEVANLFWPMNPFLTQVFTRGVKQANIVQTDSGGEPALNVVWDDAREDLIHFDSGSGCLHSLDFTTVRSWMEKDGIRLPSVVEVSRKGGWTRIVLENLEINPEISDSMFIPPHYAQ